MECLPTIRKFNSMFPNEEACVQYLLSKEVFYSTINCPGCEKPMKRYEKDLVFRCTSFSCKGRRLSMKLHTFFFKSNLKCVEILELALYWLHGVSVTSSTSLTGFSSHTVSDFYNHFRQLVSSAIDEEHVTIGGPEIVVEIDETKLGKRKYNRGHRVDGVWVLVGIERTETRKMFAIQVENRSADVLIPLIQKYVLPGSIIISDLWKSYSSLNQLGYSHLTVNHSDTFKDSTTGACTNTVEGTNNALKIKIPPRNRTKNQIDNYLFEFIWRRKNKKKLFEGFVECLRDIHYE